MIDRSFDVEDGSNLEVAIADGDVTVETHKADEVHVRVIVTAETSERARQWFEAQRFEVERSNNTVRISTNPNSFDYRAWRNEPHGSHVMVAVPQSFDTDVQTSDGDITVSSLHGAVNLKTSDGDIQTGTLSGDTITITTSDGDVRVGGLDSEDISVRSSDGDLIIGVVSTRRIVATTSDGDVRVADLSGNAELRTADGNLNLRRIDGDSVSAITSDGDIRVGSIRGRAVLRTADGSVFVEELATTTSTVHASDGIIDLSKVDGDVTVSGSDTDIHLDLRAPGGIKVTSSSGNIEIRAPQKWAADVYLRGDDVHVGSLFDLQEDFRNDSVVQGTINGGGKLLSVHASDGSVALRNK